MASRKKRSRSPSLPRLRVVPVTMLACFLLLISKTVDIVNGSHDLSQLIVTGEAIAEEATEEAKKDDHGEEEVLEDEQEMAMVDGDAPPAAATIEEEVEEEPKREFSQIELDILQSLSERREELEDWSEEVEMKEKLLEATEKRINEKVNQMKELQEEVNGLLEKYGTEEDTKIRSLVKIYENMKPKDAAQIFNELDMPILLLVIDKMSERKSAPVLAQMDPIKAKEVTTELAELRKLHAVPRRISINPNAN